MFVPAILNILNAWDLNGLRAVLSANMLHKMIDRYSALN